MFALDSIVGKHINYALDKTQHLPNKIMNNITNTEITLQDYQYFVSRIFIGLKNLNSMLLFWDTGMGKTLTAVYIIKYIKELFPRWIILIFIKKSLYIDPWLNTIRSYISDTSNIKFIYYDSSSSLDKFNNIYRSIESSLNKKSRLLIIIDEVHKLISRTVKKDNNERNFTPIYKKLIKLANFENNKILCMSATPVTNNISEFNNLIGLLRPNVMNIKEEYINNGKLINFKELRETLLAICSYKRLIEADSLTETNYIDGYAKKNIFYHNIIMSDEQSKLYNMAEKYDYKTELGGLKTMRRLISSFAFYDLKIKGDLDNIEYNDMIKRKLAEFSEFTKNINFSESFIESFKNDNIKIKTNLPITDINNYNILYQYSCKYIETCKIILNSRGKVLIFEPLVNFEGISSLKCYFNCFNISYIEYSSKTLKTRDNELNEYNNYENNNGKKVKVCIFSYAGSEGISFKCINDIIILDMPWNESELKQIIGRSIRLNSHKDLPQEYRYVNVHFLISYTNNRKSVDKEILDIIKDKQGKINVIFDLLKSSSIESIHNTYKYIEPAENEIIFDTIRKTRMKEMNVSNVIINIKLYPISYCKDYDRATILKGLLNKDTNIVYKDNTAVAKLMIDKDNIPIFIIENDTLIYIADDYYE
ncbi:nucleoside triphosphate phosphohydrolase I [Betaentomopoxvirus amoorei]|uniref:Nucleoside triphosphatase I n=1 Tax=Amsacta moorei entomopoxvirus TaxID=28321 RepID=NTP1_AMEPV|nr:nucleoside triphosphate phosphohydrolase I [Amsacta moorei entomopoxvirus]P29814.2 RecName: Full=Nucleoside triphosphatase I; AltName: Full=NPH-I; AltName: Full=Nucleoside triphosphate phosphohydrolase I; Short=NPH I [Amsacta moorei entomopoxvirus]AAA42384.1 G6L ORF; NPH I homolog of Choristoneura biennis entomopoxvirus [unidentified entomopoxvirus]AAG02898.1 AMV192 [Amsacta moorei entomopoxvirus]